MKQCFKKIGMLAVFALAFIPVSAYDFSLDGIYYNIVSLDDLTCEVTSGDEKYTGEVVIPETVTYNSRTLNVTGIGILAFNYCLGLSGVIIGNSVTTIGNSAFSSCTGLTNVTIGDSVTEIGGYAFDGCK